MLKALTKFIFFKLAGWKIIGDLNRYEKCIVLVAPHTSNWDFFVGLAVKNIQGFKGKYLIKKTWLDKPVVGQLLKNIGGVGVDRTQKTNLADQIVAYFNAHDDFKLAITPEGTRKYSPKWRSGFWYMAKGADVPVVPAVMDYGTKTVTFHPPFKLTDSKEADIEGLKAIFGKAKGKNPEKGVIPV